MSAPSFSSFPPVFGSFPDLEAGTSSSRQEATKESESSRNKRKDKKHKSIDRVDERKDKGRKHGRDKDKKRREKSPERDEDRRNRTDHKHSSRHKEGRDEKDEEARYRDEKYAAAPESSNRYFYQDRRGDELNITYGSLHSGDIPKYWHVGRGKKVLGLGRNLSVLYRGSKGLEIGESRWHNKAPQLIDSRTRALLTSSQTRRLTASSKSLLKYAEVDGFVKIPSRKGKEKEQAYRSITGNDENDSDSNSSRSGSESSDNESDTSPLSAREEALRALEQRLAKDQTSLSNWMLLLEHSIKGITPTGKNAETARAEISESILGRALAAHPTNSRSSLLRLKFLKAGEIIWEEGKVREEWEKALKDIGSADIIVEWLDWAIRSSKTFSNALEDAIRVTGLVANFGAKEDTDTTRLRIFWRIATFFRQAGYVERGFALLQAQAELSYNAPESVEHSPFEEQLDSLEEFWESEVPRVGEAHAKGWKMWKSNPKGTAGRRPKKISKCRSADPYAIWHHDEEQADMHLIFPARMPNDEGDENLSDKDSNSENDEDEEEDPFATILFSDIRPFLIQLRTSKSRSMLRLVWLSYLGLHVPGLSSALSSTNLSSDDRWADTAFLQHRFLQTLFPQTTNLPLITSDSYNGITIGREKAYAQSFDAIKSWGWGVLEPLEGLAVDGKFRMWSTNCLQEFAPEITDTLSRIFKEIQLEDDSMPWNLAFEATKHRPERSIKIPSASTSSLELEASYAYLNRIEHKFDKARQLYRSALRESTQATRPDVVCMWWGFAELEWLLSKRTAALQVVLCAGGVPMESLSAEVSSVQILRARSGLEERCQQRVISEWKFRLKWIKLRILLELLAGTFEAAIGVAERLLASEEGGSIQHESLTVASLNMFYHHTVTLRNHAPPAVLRELVQKALDVYPSNTVVLGLFLECEKGEGVWGRVRALMSEFPPGALQDKSVARRLFEVWVANWEEGRWKGEVERVRAGLEAAVLSDRTKGSPILWKVFVKFELAAGDVKRAKAVLFRALRDCPLVKELYLLAFDEDFRHAYSHKELIDLSDTMAERGIRLRHSLGELLNKHGQATEGEGSELDESTSVIEDIDDEQAYESRELRRLMPY